MEDAMKVTDFRLTCIWVEGARQVLGTQDVGTLGACVQQDIYASLFNRLLQPDDHPLFTVPWSRRSGKLFPDRNSYWAKYVVADLTNSAADKRGNKAWKAIVPLRRKDHLVTFERNERCFIEGWFYPHGIALTATCWFRTVQGYDPGELEAVAATFLSGPLDVVWPGAKRQRLGLDGLSRACLDQLRQEAFGAIEPGAQPDPLRILTVVSAQADPADKKPKDTERAVLQAAITAIGGNAEAATRPEPGSHIHVLSKGRVIWRPDKARAARGNTHTMGCLHRNIVVATTQVASLLRGVDAFLAALEEDNGAMAPRAEPYAKRLAEQLAQIHGGKDTYDQACLRSQTEAAKDRINRLRAAVGSGAIA